MEFILPVWLEDKYTSAYTLWHIACEESEKSYGYLIAEGQSPQQARTVLNNSLKTEIVVTANIREWRHILSLRTSKAAHPQMKALMDEILFSFKDKYGVFFYDIWAKSN
jgi:thymidylate synthase (FAD)